MFLNNCVVAALAACASVVLALPRPDAFELSLPGGEDHGWEYKRGVAETFVCKRGNEYVSFISFSSILQASDAELHD
jgi:hypothetical protein